MTRSDTIQTYRANPGQAREAQEQLQNLLARSATDMDFRHKLLNDPRATVAEFTGHDVPESVSFRFIENKADATFVLPNPVSSEAELSETELETVAGGIAFTIYLAAAAISAFAAGYTSDQ
jgi:hypothetical protein